MPSRTEFGRSDSLASMLSLQSSLSVGDLGPELKGTIKGYFFGQPFPQVGDCVIARIKATLTLTPT